MSINYNSIALVALKTIADFGVPVVFVNKENPGGYDPVTGEEVDEGVTEIETYGVSISLEKSENKDSLSDAEIILMIPQTDIEIYTDAGLNFMGSDYRVKVIKKIAPGGVVVAQEVGLIR